MSANKTILYIYKGETMQRYKKYELEKSSKEKELFLQEHKGEDAMILYECYKDFNDLVNKYTNALHVKLFSEESDYMCDSNIDVKNRAKGINPMNEEYAKKVNLKRASLGFLPLAKNGMPCDSDKTLEYCKEKILTLLCKTKYDDLAKN